MRRSHGAEERVSLLDAKGIMLSFRGVAALSDVRVPVKNVVGGIGGQVFALFVIVLAAAEAAVGLAIVLAIFQTFKTIDVRFADLMRE